MKKVRIPAYHEYFNPILKALRLLGGSGSIEEIDSKATELMDLDEETLEKPHNPETGNATEVQYRLAWGRTYLKKYGLIDNSSRGVWTLLPKSVDFETVDAKDVIRKVNSDRKPKRAKQNRQSKNETSLDVNIGDEEQAWTAALHKILTEELSPGAFEKLIQRVLRESGFIQVDVTGRSGDGGIDGKGIAKIHGLMSFHVVFQAKRYKGKAITSGDIRNFRGAMVGRADKGLFVTTSSFTRDALKEATRDGATPIDLLDGDELAETLRKLNLGVKTRIIEIGEVDPSWFKQF